MSQIIGVNEKNYPSCEVNEKSPRLRSSAAAELIFLKFSEILTHGQKLPKLLAR
jgi:hypothetical protein